MRTLGKARGLAGALALALAAAACAPPPPPPPPTDAELSVIRESLLVEAMLQDFNGPRRQELAGTYYQQLFEKYGLDAEDLVVLRERFSRDPELWVVAADTTVAQLKRLRGDAAAALTQASGTGNPAADTLRTR